MKSRARFYVLQGSDGKVFPFTRPTIGTAAFSLKPGEEYKFCWCLVVGREIQRIVAGQLLEVAEDFQNEELPMLFPQSAPEIELPDAEQLGPGAAGRNRVLERPRATLKGLRKQCFAIVLGALMYVQCAYRSKAVRAVCAFWPMVIWKRYLWTCVEDVFMT